ncbi:MAG: hypothetical protein HY700_19375 [Gemmatimonadetes bacterium]|nr:hypothetical protein [Gemmatimonadota bacterium]
MRSDLLYGASQRLAHHGNLDLAVVQDLLVVVRFEERVDGNDDGADGEVKGTLHIAEPQQFWANSRFLIIVEG